MIQEKKKKKVYSTTTPLSRPPPHTHRNRGRSLVDGLGGL